MGKGKFGESCKEAIRNSLKLGEVVTFSELFRRVRNKGNWKDDTIYQHLMALVVNLPPARRHWPHVGPFLLLHEDGTYELYDPNKHKKVKE